MSKLDILWKKFLLLAWVSFEASAFVDRSAVDRELPRNSFPVLAASRASERNESNKWILVTGGNGGIGSAICERLLRLYPDVVAVLASRSLERGKGVARAIQQTLGHEACAGRLIVVPMDVTSDESAQHAVDLVQQHTDKLYGIVNNAGIKIPENRAESVLVNYEGPRRVTDAFLPMVEKPGGRIVNLASDFSAPNFISKCKDNVLQQKLAQPWTIEGGISELDYIAQDPQHCGSEDDAYGFSKALVSAYTWLLAKENPELLINSVSPGFIATAMTKGQGAVDPPSKGAVPPVWLLMDQEVRTGYYFGSDCQRSPLDVYRPPGDPPYDGPNGYKLRTAPSVRST